MGIPRTRGWINPGNCLDQKIKNNLFNFDSRTLSPGVESTTFISPCGWVHHYTPSVLSGWHTFKILLFIEATDYRSKFAKTILFENCSCFSKIPFSISVESAWIFQCLISIPAGHWVQQIDGDLPRWFVSFTHPCDQHDRKIRTIRKSAAWWRGRRARGYRKLMFVRICYMFLISKCRGDSYLGLCTTSVLALRPRMRDGRMWEKIVFERRKNRILPLHFDSPNASTEVVHRPTSQSPLLFNIRNI